MKKIKFSAIGQHKHDLLNRDQLRNILGGDDMLFTDGECKKETESCDTDGGVNCCSNLICVNWSCKRQTF